MSLTTEDQRSVLIVEDEQIVAIDLQEHLEGMGYRVVAVAVTGEEAIVLARDCRPQIVVMDISLKGKLDGVDAAAHIGKTLRIPVVFLTSFSDSATVARAVSSAPYGYLTKPFQPRELRATLEVALVKAKLERQLRESEQWFSLTLRCVGDAVIATDDAGVVTFLNPEAERITGWSLNDARGSPIEDIVCLESGVSGAALPSPARKALAEVRTTDLEHGARLRGRAGSRIPVDDSAAPIRAEDGTVLGAVIVMRDVTERQRRESLLRRSEEQFRSVFEFASIGMALVALDGYYLKVNDAFCAIVGHSAGDLLEMRFSDTALTEPADVEVEKAHLYALMAGVIPATQYEKRYRGPSGGADRAVLVSASLLREGDEPMCFAFQVYDLTERKHLESELRSLAYFDPLTGLPNRAHLRGELERLVADARRHRERLAVLFMDLDRFKSVNDTLGHEAGDELLKTVGERVRAVLRETDCVARLGGDEFVVALSGIGDPSYVATVTEKIRRAVEQPTVVGARELVVTPSIGVSFYPDDGTTVSDLLRNADSALYAAKTEGRNRVSFYRPELGRLAEARLGMENDLRRAIETGGLFLEYQPIVRLQDGEIVAAEALVRWTRNGELVPPSAFVALAEDTGLIIPLGEWVLKKACAAAQKWPSQVGINVNCSPKQFHDDHLNRAVDAALSDSGLPPHRLTLELTESAMLETTAEQQIRVGRLRALGVEVSIDDYGTGYSSLAYIKSYSPYSLKIDRFFINELGADTSSAAIVSATLAMARDLGIAIVAEGIETDDQLSWLLTKNCEFGQGFLLSRPVREDVFLQLLQGGGKLVNANYELKSMDRGVHDL